VLLVYYDGSNKDGQTHQANHLFTLWVHLTIIVLVPLTLSLTGSVALISASEGSKSMLLVSPVIVNVIAIDMMF
jgi:hypothetical protein